MNDRTKKVTSKHTSFVILLFYQNFTNLSSSLFLICINLAHLCTHCSRKFFISVSHFLVKLTSKIWVKKHLKCKKIFLFNGCAGAKVWKVYLGTYMGNLGKSLQILNQMHKLSGEKMWFSVFLPATWSIRQHLILWSSYTTLHTCAHLITQCVVIT